MLMLTCNIMLASVTLANIANLNLSIFFTKNNVRVIQSYALVKELMVFMSN